MHKIDKSDLLFSGFLDIHKYFNKTEKQAVRAALCCMVIDKTDNQLLYNEESSEQRIKELLI